MIRWLHEGPTRATRAQTPLPLHLHCLASLDFIDRHQHHILFVVFTCRLRSKLLHPEEFYPESLISLA